MGMQPAPTTLPTSIFGRSAADDRTDLKARFCTVCFALCELFRLCITKPDLSTLCFRGHECNLHKLILHDFEKIADNFFTI